MPNHVILNGEKIQESRTDLGLTRDELADRIGMSRTGLWKIETGRVTTRGSSIHLASAIAQALELDLEEIVQEAVV